MPGRLVDHDQVFVLKADIERDRLRDRYIIFNLREKYDEILVALNALRGVADNRSLRAHKAGFDQVLEPSA